MSCMLVGKGDRHWCVISSGVIDSACCFVVKDSGVVYCVPNGMCLTVQAHQKGFALYANVFDNRMVYTFYYIRDDGSLGTEEGECGQSHDFSGLWTKVVSFRRSGFVFKDPKIQDAIRRQILAQGYLSKELPFYDLVTRFVSSQSFTVTPPTKPDPLPTKKLMLEDEDHCPSLGAQLAKAGVDLRFHAKPRDTPPFLVAVTEKTPELDFSSLLQQFAGLVSQFIPVDFGAPDCGWFRFFWM